MKYCKNCGTPMADGAAFCPRCGAGLQVQQQGQQPPYGAASGPQYPARRQVRVGMLSAGLICLIAMVVALFKPSIIPYSLPLAIALAILGIMFLVLAWSPKEAPGLLGKAAGMSKGAFAGVCIALAIVIPAVGEAGGLLPQEYKLMGTWRLAGEEEMILLKLERGSFTISRLGDESISGSWSYQDDILTLSPSLFSGEEPITGRAQLLGKMMTFSVMGDETVLFYRYS